jgi:hypothetical protein
MWLMTFAHTKKPSREQFSEIEWRMDFFATQEKIRKLYETTHVKTI